MAAAELTPLEAARAVAQAERWDRTLARRTEGAIWMVWGIVVSAMFVSYGYAASSHVADWVFATLWAPWTAAGILTTIALQRIVRAHAPAPAPVRERRVLVGVAVVALAFTLMGAVLRPTNATTPLMIDGAVWTFAGAFNAFRFSWEGRLMLATSGVGCIVVGAGLWLLHPAEDAAGLVATFTIAILALGTGFARVLKG